MRANREQGEHGTENASSCSGPNGEATIITDMNQLFDVFGEPK